MNAIDLAAPPIAKINSFQGLFARGKGVGQIDDVPPNHQSICNNAIFPGPTQISSRFGSSTLTPFSASGVVAWFHALTAIITARDFILYMDGNGNLYDGSTLLHSWPGANDFAAVNLAGRVYICPKLNGVFYPNGGLWYYNGAGALVPAGGFAPATGPSVAQGGVGTVFAGVHGVAVSFLTETGFLTPPSPINNVTSDGAHTISVTNIQTTPAPQRAVGRVLLMTKAGGTILYFVPGGTIHDMSTTTFTITTADTALVASADYLNNLLAIPPAGSDLHTYKNRLCIAGPQNSGGFGNLIFFSRVNDLESFDQVLGVMTVTTDIVTEPVRALSEVRDILYIFKFTGTYSTIDNGQDPVNWSVSVIDYGLGASSRGLSTFEWSTTGRDIYESILVAHKAGLFLFTGVYTAIPLSFKIEALWLSINAAAFHKVHIAHDIWNKQFWVAVPTGTNTYCDTIIYFDYTDGLDPENINISLWTFPDAIGMLGMAFLTTYDNTYTLKFSCVNNSTFAKYDITQTQDYSTTPINFTIQIPPNPPDSNGRTTIFTGLNFRVIGSGQLLIIIANADGNHSQALTALTLSTGIGYELQRLIQQFNEERIVITLFNSPFGFLTLYKIDIFGNPAYSMRPSL